MSARITQCPKKVKSEIGTVNNPVTQVADVDVKKRSIKGIGRNCAIGNVSNNVPIPIVDIIEIKIIRAGEK